ncbi:MAG TPA: sugar phosphate isomerase/epimerase [Blastocatellia bacterium]|nr:sugar phosphate isomerase/epimerase [Blastocatellia bacterium]
MIDRRRFLSTTSQAVIGAVALTALNRTSGEAAANEPGKPGKPAKPGKLASIGVQLYTVRGQMEKDFEDPFKQIAAIGYKEVEFAGYYNKSPKDVLAVLNRYGLTAPAAHVPLATIQTNIDQAIEAAKAIGHKFLICPYLEDKDRRTLDDYRRHAEAFNRAGEACRKAGIQFGYHNHDFEFEAKDGKLPYDLLLEQTDKDLVKMELDLYWISKAGQNPLAYIDKYKDRFALFHVKEMDKTPKRGITEVGRGVIDFKTIFAKTPAGAIKHYFVEQDTCPGSPFDSIKVSFDYLKQLEF